MTLSHTDLSLLERMGDSRYRADAWSVFVDRYTELFFTWFVTVQSRYWPNNCGADNPDRNVEIAKYRYSST